MQINNSFIFWFLSMFISLISNKIAFSFPELTNVPTDLSASL